MKKSGYYPDVVAYTAMLHAYSAAGRTNEMLQMVNEVFYSFEVTSLLCSSGHWEKTYALFEEMIKNDIKLDTICCAALMKAFNEGGQPRRVLNLAESMREREIPFTDAVIFEMLSACSL